MQRVSNAYRNSMKSSLRERGYILISFGLVNQNAQNHAKVDDGDFTWFSSKKKIFAQGESDTVYGTLEEKFTRVDGSMFFLPRKESGLAYYDTGLTGNPLVSEGAFEINLSLNIPASDFRGLTIDFGENYPTDFEVFGENNSVRFKDNASGKFMTEEVFEDTSSLRIVIYRMKNPDSRVRIFSILFGYGLTYTNKDVMDSSMESYVSPIGADVPQIDFSVTLTNYNKYFNVDNPKSAIHFLETGQEMDIYYGYELPETGEIEWLKGNHLLCSEWESDDYTATIRCQDIFRNMETEYYKGQYTQEGKSYYELAETIMKDAGLEEYYIDPRLKILYTKNPIPRVTHKEALQIIANACRCVLSQTREGTALIKSNFRPEVTVSTEGEAEYSKVENVLKIGDKAEYASLATSYTVPDGSMYFLPRELGGSGRETGYISDVISDENGSFTENPKLTFVQEAACMYYGVQFRFGNALPSGIKITTYNDSELVEEYEVEDEIVKTMIVLHTFSDFDKMVVEFTGTKEPYNRIVVNYFAFGDITNYVMTRRDMMSSPKAIKQELIKDVVVPCYTYQAGAAEESLVSEEIEIKEGDVYTFFVGEPSYNLRVTLDEGEEGATIIEHGSYYVTVEFSVTGKHQLEVFGYRYKIVERYAVQNLNTTGKTIKWENPLISDMEMALDLAKWLGDYYKAALEYEYDTRGIPELDVNDVIYQENDFYDDMKVTVYRNTLNFGQGFSGKVSARRMGE